MKTRPGAKPRPFIIHALPRSRTAWLAHFLTYGGWSCHHEVAIRMRGMDDVVRLFATPRTGTVETAASPGWYLLRAYLPNLRTVVVRRPVDDVVASMMRLNVAGFTYEEAPLRTQMTRVARALDRVSALPGVMTVDHADLDREDCCAAIFEHCLPYDFPRDWWERMRDLNIQVDVAAVLRYYHEHRDEVEAFKRTLRSELRALARNRPRRLEAA